MTFFSLSAWVVRVSGWLRQGISPRRLALTLALGFVLGCFPIFGVTTLLCLVLAMAFGLNPLAMQAANYAAMPLQLALIWPFVRMGERLLPAEFRHSGALPGLHGSPVAMIKFFGGAAEAAVLAWLLFAVPAAMGITLLLTPILRRVPLLAAAEAAPRTKFGK